MSNSQLAGIRVLDLSQFLPGPYAAQICADMGADVLKIEPPAGDPLRHLNPLTNERSAAPFHRVINAGKRVVLLDLKSDDGKSLFEKLVARADVLIESYRPGVLERLGLGAEHLKTLNSGLIHCALSGYGQTGPLRERSGHDINYMAMSGGLAMTGPQSRPVSAFPPVADYAGAMQAVISILGALIGRGRTGTGAYLDVAMADTVLAWQAFGLTQQNQAGTDASPVPQRAGTLLNGGAACYQVYPTKDHKFVSLGAIEAVFWRNFCAAVEQDDWVDRQTEPQPQTELIAAVTALFLTRDRADWDHLLGAVDCCYHPVLDYSELPDWPQIKNRNSIQRQPETGAFEGLRLPVWCDGAAPADRLPLREITRQEALDGWS